MPFYEERGKIGIFRMITAKTESLQSAKRVEELYSDAMNAFRKYSGNGGDVNEDYGGY